ASYEMGALVSGYQDTTLGYIGDKVAQAAVGCATGAIAGGSCTSRALGAALSAMAMDAYLGALDRSAYTAAEWFAIQQRMGKIGELAAALGATLTGQNADEAVSAAQNVAENSGKDLDWLLGTTRENFAGLGDTIDEVITALSVREPKVANQVRAEVNITREQAEEIAAATGVSVEEVEWDFQTMAALTSRQSANAQVLEYMRAAGVDEALIQAASSVMAQGGWVMWDAEGHPIFEANGMPSFGYNPITVETLLPPGGASSPTGALSPLKNAAAMARQVMAEASALIAKYGDTVEYIVNGMVYTALTVTSGPLAAAGKAAIDKLVDLAMETLLSGAVETGLNKIADGYEWLDQSLTRDESLTLSTASAIIAVLGISGKQAAQDLLKSAKSVIEKARHTGGLPKVDLPNRIAVPNDLRTNIHPGAQDKHIPGTNNYDPARSTLTADPQTLLDGVHSGQYPIVRKIPRGNTASYIVDFGSPIGDFKNNGTLVGPTQYGQLVQGKHGVHIIPANPNQF
ncbi:polymorphic toxin type 50 domain-containing protein, partial [Rhodospirillum sp. A1_3_36]|uniref:polymorphic toxin type 50 domain-containing protein n=1 Tax=Rhodospirillum sp. A1_3_36 TaxID=3391666 RepID=UPI0039A6D84B